MPILERYLAKVVALSIFAVFLGLVSLYSFFSLLRVSQLIGQGNYQLSDALHYLLFTLPGLSFEVFPASALLGCLLGISYLSSQREITAMRCAGVSNLAIVRALLKIGLLFALLVFILGEFIAPVTERIAIKHQNTALNPSLTVDIKNELWLKHQHSFANIQSVKADKTLYDIRIYTFSDDNQQLVSTIHAKSAQFQPPNWLLNEVNISHFKPMRIETEQKAQLVWQLPLDLSVMDILSKEIKNLSARELYDYAKYLELNKLDADYYWLLFWQKLAAPLTLLVMILLAYPFSVFTTRTTNLAGRIVVGVIIGVIFNILNKITAEFGLLYNLPIALSALLLTLLCLVLSLVLIRKMI